MMDYHAIHGHDIASWDTPDVTREFLSESSCGSPELTKGFYQTVSQRYRLHRHWKT